MLLSRKRVLFTGSTRGIGLASAKMFLEEGARVVINGTTAQGMKRALEDLTAYDADVRGIVNDISSSSGVKELFHEAINFLGGIDILINNAGIYPTGQPLVEIEESLWEKTINTNLKSVYLCSSIAAKQMKIQGTGGVILNAASFAASIPSIGAGLYSVTKVSVINLTKSLAAELAPYGIRVNAYSPGVIETDMPAEVLKNNRNFIISQIALQRLGKPEEIAAPIVFLASPRSSYITGAALDISGGKLIVQNPIQFEGEQ